MKTLAAASGFLSILGSGAVSSAVPPSFLPPDLAGLELWLDSADVTTILEEDTVDFVSRWNDKGSLGFDVTQGISADQPKTRVNTLRGLNTITFDGIGDRLSNLDFDGLDEADGYTIFLLISMTRTNREGLFALTDNGGHGEFLEKNSNYRFLHRFPYGSAVNDDLNNIGTVTLGPQILTYARDKAGNSQEMFKDGVSIGSLGTLVSDAYDNVMKEINLGTLSPNSAAFSFDGDMCEIIIYSRALLVAEREEVEDYLFNKWLAPLPFPFAFSSDFSSDFS